MFEIELGAKVRDKITKIDAIVTGRSDFLTGCSQYALEWNAGGEMNSRWIDEDRLEVLDEKGAQDLAEEFELAGSRSRGGPSRGPESRR